MILRSRFKKTGDMVFISHLDLIRVFERAMRRANIPIAYTQGFNPHPIMAFATALGIGISSEGEYVDIELSHSISPQDFANRLNEVFPKGLEIIKSISINSKDQSLMSLIQSAIYIVKARLEESFTEEETVEAVKMIISTKEIMEKKEKKKRPQRKRRKEEFKEVNIRPMINELFLFSFDQKEIIFKMNLATGSQGNLKPEVVIKKIKEITNMPIDLDSVRIHRLELLTERDGERVTPFDILDSLQ